MKIVPNHLFTPPGDTLSRAALNKKNQNPDFTAVLNQARQAQDDKKLRQACQDLESVFINQVVESMRAAIPRNSLMGNSFALETFESMLFTEYSREMSRTASLGIADMIYQQLSSDKN
ncbi:rod-binding protein [Syntrophomonas erecta]